MERIKQMKQYIMLGIILLSIPLLGMDKSTYTQEEQETIKKMIFGSPWSVTCNEMCHYLQGCPDFMTWKDEEGNTFLHKVAEFSGDEKVIELLLGQGPDLMVKNGEGQTVEQVIQANDNIAYVLITYKDQPWTVDPQTRKLKLLGDSGITDNPFEQKPVPSHHDDDEKLAKSSWYGSLGSYFTIRNVIYIGTSYFVVRFAWKRYARSKKQEPAT